MFCLLQAASEISSRGDNRDRDVNIFVQRRYMVYFLVERNAISRLLPDEFESCSLLLKNLIDRT